MEFSDGRGGELSQGASDNVPRQAKRKMKTPSQIDVLEKAYNVSSKLSEHMRLELAMKTDLSSREISMWFANKRFQRKQTHLLMESNREGEHPLPLQLTPSRGGSGFELAARHFMDSSTNGEWLREKSSKMNLRIPAAPQVKRKNHVLQVMPQIKTSHHALELSVVTFVERKLGGRLRDDGPLIGIKFDPLPPGAFGSALCSSNERKQKPEQPTKTTEVESILKQNEGINKASSLFQQMKFSLSKNSTRGLPISEIGCTVHPDSVHNLSSKFPCFPYGKHHPQKTDLHPDCSLQADAQFTTDPVNVIVDKFVLTDTLASDFSCQVEKLCKSEKVQTSIKVEDLCRLVARRKQCVKRKGKEKTQTYSEMHDLELHNEKEVEILEKYSLEGKLQHANQTDGCKKLLNSRSLENEEMRKPKELRCGAAAIEESASKTFIAHGNIQGNMKLIEDEQLELMKLAASKIGLHSINFLDKDTLDKLHSFKDLLGPFPPESVSMKRPFAVSPWADSEENVGNLLMVWKFLVTFAGDLGLWPFTLDEFAQAFHDHDSRLLAELHVALLKYIIRDLEDARKICAYGPHICENNASDNPGNLSLNIVYGANAWGFDMDLWKSRLNFFTWPEILRQVALSAGFGPKLKKNAGFASCHGYKDGNFSDWSESLDKHAGGSNSVIVKEKDKSSSCDSSYPLIPGTLEFAVFQAFFLAGKDGLTPVEIADCIHKHRLCDLTTMESVHASIANILSKDIELFERVGLAIFRIKPCFRRDPSVVEKILAGLVDRADDIADSFDEYHIDLTREGLHDFKRNKGSTSLRKSKQIMSADDPVLINESGFENVDQVSLFFLENSEDGIVLSSKSDELSDSIYEACSSCGDMKGKEHISVSWIQELSEGEYFLLSTEERLKVLVTLVNVVAEGNSFHTVIEKRLKEAQIYKKKMMEKMRLNKKLLEESHGHIDDANYAYANASSFTKHALKCSPNFVNSSSSQTKYLWQQFSPSSSCIVPEKFEHTATLNLSKLKVFIDKQAEMLHSYRFVPLGEDRRHNRYWQFSTSSSRNDPGSGRIFFESSDGFWRVIDSDEALDAILAALDIHGIRESHLYFMLKHVETTFKDTTRRRKSREFYGESTSVSLQKSIFPDYYTADHNNGSTTVLPTFDSLQSSPSLKIDLVNDDEERSSASKKYLHYMKWMWQECFNAEVLHAMRYGTKRCLQLLETCHICYQSCLADEKHCTSCHVTFSISSSSFEHFSEHSARCKADSKIPISIPLLLINIQLLKAQLAIIEASIPMEAFHPFWDDSYRKLWGIKLKHSSSAREILQSLTLLENAIKPECLCPDFITTNEVLNTEVDLVGAKAIASKQISIIPWIPETTAAVALRLLDLDASIPYMLKHGLETLDGSEAGDDFLVLPRSIAVATGGGRNGGLHGILGEGNSNMESFGTSENGDKIENSCESSGSLRAAACSCKMNAGSANTRRETRVLDAGAALFHGEAVESNEYLRWQEAVDSYLDIEDCSNERDIAAFPAKSEDGGENFSSVSTK